MKAAPLSLDLAYPTLIHLVTELEGSCDAGYDVQCDLQFAQNKEQQRRWRIELGVTFSAKGVKRPAYKGEVRYVGFFTVAADYPDNKITHFVAVTGSSIRASLSVMPAKRTTCLPQSTSLSATMISPQLETPQRRLLKLLENGSLSL